MAIRQYIGARYVPRFLGPYDNTQVYEALDVVDNGLGTSYIAKQPTPAGTPLTNTKYWAIYGASSGAIINLQNQIDNINDEITRNIIIIGNSYVLHGCADKLGSLFKNSYKYQSGGAGFIHRTAHTVDFYDLLNTAAADTSFDNDSITDIIFVSAYGDSGGITEMGYSTYLAGVESQLATINNYIATTFVNCKKVMVTLAESRNIPKTTNTIYSSAFAAHKMFKAICNEYAMDYLGWCGWNLMFRGSSYFESDGAHPYGVGIDIIAEDMVNAYFGNLHYMTKVSEIVATVALTSGGTPVCPLRSFVTPDDITLEVRVLNGIAAGSITAAANDVFIDSDTLPIPIITPLDYTSLRIVAPLFDDHNNNPATIILDLKDNSDGVGILYFALTPSGTLSNNSLFSPSLSSLSYKI